MALSGAYTRPSTATYVYKYTLHMIRTHLYNTYVCIRYRATQMMLPRSTNPARPRTQHIIWEYVAERVQISMHTKLNYTTVAPCGLYRRTCVAMKRLLSLCTQGLTRSQRIEEFRECIHKRNIYRIVSNLLMLIPMYTVMYYI